MGLRSAHRRYRILVGSGVLRASHYADVDGFGASGFNVVQNSNMWRLLSVLLVLRPMHVAMPKEEQDGQSEERQEMLSPKEPVC